MMTDQSNLPRSLTAQALDARAPAFDVLILAPTPTYPQDFGNRKHIHMVCTELQARGMRLHYLYYPAESDWRDAMPELARRRMAEQFASFTVLPTTRPLHMPAQGRDHAIDEWWDPAIGDYLGWLFRVATFDAFVVNYTWLSRALDFAPQRTLKVLMTHDRFSGRRELLEKNGVKAEFFHLTEAEEARGLDRADLVLAIKDQEAEFFRTVTKREVATLAHVEPAREVARRDPPGWGATFGIIGARNNVNLMNLRAFLDVAKPRFREAMAPMRIKIAGSICEEFELGVHPFVEFVGRVGDVDEFYSEIDVALVPMSFSTGLKIKAGEALARGVGVIAHEHAFEGYPVTDPLQSLGSFEEVADAVIACAFDRSRIAALREASARSYALLRQGFDATLDLFVERVRAKAGGLLVTVPNEALDARTRKASHLASQIGYLRHAMPLTFYIDRPFDEQAVGEIERLSHTGQVVIAPRVAAALRLPAAVQGQLEAFVRVGSIEDIFRLRSIAASWLASIPTDPRDQAALVAVPAYLRADMTWPRTSDMARKPELAALEEGPNGLVIVESSLTRLARARGLFPRAAQRLVPTDYNALPKRLAPRWSTDLRMGAMLIAPRIDHPIVGLVAGLALRLSERRGGRVTVIAREGGSAPARHERLRALTLAEAEADLGLILDAPRFLVDFAPEDADFAWLRAAARRGGIPCIEAGGRAGGAPGIDARELEAAGFLAILREVAEFSDDTAAYRFRARRELEKAHIEFAADAGWAAIWRDLRRLVQLNRASNVFG